MHWLVIGAVAVVIHISGIVTAIAPTLGGIGVILDTADRTVAGVTGVRNYLAKRKLTKTLPIKPVSIPMPKKAKPPFHNGFDFSTRASN